MARCSLQTVSICSSRLSMSMTGTGWSGYVHYWLGQWEDGEGGWLGKPKVTYFTVGSDRGMAWPSLATCMCRPLAAVR